MPQDGAPQVLIGVDDLAQRRGEVLDAAEALVGLPDHALEAVDLAGQAPAAGLGALEAEGQLEVLLVADEHGAQLGDLGEGLPQLGLAALPEGGPVVQVEAHRGAVPPGGAGDLEAEPAGLGAQRRDETGHVDDPDALVAEDAVEIEVLGAQRAADLAGAVVPDAGAAVAVARVGDVELVAVAPGPALGDLGALVGHVASGQVGLDELGDGGARDEVREDLHGLAEVAGDGADIGLGARHLEHELVGDVHRLTGGRTDAHPHAGGDDEAPLGVFAQLHGVAFLGCPFRRRSHRGSAPAGRACSTA